MEETLNLAYPLGSDPTIPRGSNCMRRSSRRQFLATTALSLGAVPLIRPLCAEMSAQSSAVFRHGVASGDPLADRIVLWTRVSATRGDSVEVRWSVATDPRMARVVARGERRTSAARDFP